MEVGTLAELRLLIFDLDGTLVDSAEDIGLSVNELRGDLGLAPLPIEQVQSYIGNGVRRLLSRSLESPAPDTGAAATPRPPAEAELDRAVSLYLPIYRRRLLDHTRAYPGVPEALGELARDRTLAVLTNKPRQESVTILEGLSLAGHFRAIYGGDSFAHRKPHPAGVNHLLSELGGRTEETLFVGDTSVDMETAANASVRSCLVTYGMGFAKAKELEPDIVVEDLRDLARAVIPR